MKIFWFIPTIGDNHFLNSPQHKREVDFSYCKQIAEASDRLGYEGVLIPTGASCDDAWVVASMLVPVTKNLKFLVAVRPGFIQPIVAARMASTFDRFSDGRLLINVVAGGDPKEQAADGLDLEHDARYELVDEFLDIYRQATAGETVDYEGQYLSSKGGKLQKLPLQKAPPLYFGGSSEKGIEVGAKHIDTFLTWGEPVEQVKAKVDRIRAEAALQGRTVDFGIRLHVIVRETEAEAWDAADKLIQYVTDEEIEKAQKYFASMDSQSQKNMADLHKGDRNRLEIAPNLWAGLGLVRRGAATALVGDPDTVVQRLKEYQAVGIDKFILSGYPHLEEAYRTAELLFPRLKQEKLLREVA